MSLEIYNNELGYKYALNFMKARKISAKNRDKIMGFDKILNNGV